MMIDVLVAISLTVFSFYVGLKIYNKTKISFFNPIIISMIIILGIMSIFNYSYEDYSKGAAVINWFLPFTIILLAIPLYQQVKLLLKHKKAIIYGVLASVITSFISVVGLAKIFGVDKQIMLSLIPKSITTPLGIVTSNSISGITALTVVAIVFTGVLGVILYPIVFKVFRIHHPIAKGISMGASSHAVGTSKALELGEVEGAMSSLAIIVTGIVTVVIIPIIVKVL